jgi:hypothetical protein
MPVLSHPDKKRSMATSSWPVKAGAFSRAVVFSTDAPACRTYILRSDLPAAVGRTADLPPDTPSAGIKPEVGGKARAGNSVKA